MKQVASKRSQASSARRAANSQRRETGPVEALVAAAREDFVTFVQLCFHALAPNTRLLMNWHIQAIAYQLEQVRLGQQKRLIISMPPRHLKSILTSVAFPAFLLGKNPSKSIIVASYGKDLAIKHANDFRAVISSPIYRRIFPNVQIGKNTETEVVTTAGGCRVATSVEGPLTGRGCDIAIIDDPLKPGDALSDPKREGVNTWFFQTLLSRLNDPRTAAMILVMQRLHQNDLAGTLLRSPDDWFNLQLPAVSTCDEEIQVASDQYHKRREGVALHAERMSVEELEKVRDLVGSDTWHAQYQQSPVPSGGYMVKRDWVQRYETLPERKPGAFVIQSIDTALKAGPNNDYSVITTWLLQRNCYWLIDVARKKLEYPALKAFVLENASKHQPRKILIEDVGTGTALIQELKYMAYSVVGVRPDHDKLTRMQIAAAKFESGKVFIPRSAPWLAEFEAELFSFPQSRNDDQIDSVSQVLTDTTSSYDLYALTEGLTKMFSPPAWNVIY